MAGISTAGLTAPCVRLNSTARPQLASSRVHVVSTKQHQQLAVSCTARDQKAQSLKSRAAGVAAAVVISLSAVSSPGGSFLGGMG
jgi:hypothetical protein